jgi:multisubunit Na+/H+ antiporter MnhF subunit
MEQPPPDLNPETTGAHPPKLNKRTLWLSLLLPGILTAIGMLILLAAGSNTEPILNIGMIIVILATIGTWVSFSRCISPRFVGPSRVLLILSYPILQAILVCTVFFAGCLAIVAKEGIH